MTQSPQNASPRPRKPLHKHVSHTWTTLRTDHKSVFKTLVAVLVVLAVLVLTVPTVVAINATNQMNEQAKVVRDQKNLLTDYGHHKSQELAQAQGEIPDSSAPAPTSGSSPAAPGQVPAAPPAPSSGAPVIVPAAQVNTDPGVSQALNKLGFKSDTFKTDVDWNLANRVTAGQDVFGNQRPTTAAGLVSSIRSSGAIDLLNGGRAANSNIADWRPVQATEPIKYEAGMMSVDQFGNVTTNTNFVDPAGAVLWVNTATGAIVRQACLNPVKAAPVPTKAQPSYPLLSTPVGTPTTPPIVQQFEYVCRNGVDNMKIPAGTRLSSDSEVGSKACHPPVVQPQYTDVCRKADNGTWSKLFHILVSDRLSTDLPVDSQECQPVVQPQYTDVCRKADNGTWSKLFHILVSDRLSTDLPVDSQECQPVVQPQYTDVCRKADNGTWSKLFHILVSDRLSTDLPVDSQECQPKPPCEWDSSLPADSPQCLAPKTGHTPTEQGAPPSKVDGPATPPAQQTSTTETGGRGGSVSDTITNTGGTETGVTAPSATTPNPIQTDKPNEGGTPTNTTPVVAGDAIDGPTTPAAAPAAAPVVTPQAAPAPAPAAPQVAPAAAPVQQAAPVAKPAPVQAAPAAPAPAVKPVPAPTAQVIAQPAPVKQTPVATASTTATAQAPATTAHAAAQTNSPVVAHVAVAGAASAPGAA